MQTLKSESTNEDDVIFLEYRANEDELNDQKKSCRKPVQQIEIHSGKIIRRFSSGQELCRTLGLNQAEISKCCNGLKDSAYGYRWQFATSFEHGNQ
jgi:hypothetical protein